MTQKQVRCRTIKWAEGHVDLYRRMDSCDMAYVKVACRNEHSEWCGTPIYVPPWKKFSGWGYISAEEAELAELFHANVSPSKPSTGFRVVRILGSDRVSPYVRGEAEVIHREGEWTWGRWESPLFVYADIQAAVGATKHVVGAWEIWECEFIPDPALQTARVILEEAKNGSIIRQFWHDVRSGQFKNRERMWRPFVAPLPTDTVLAEAVRTIRPIGWRCPPIMTVTNSQG